MANPYVTGRKVPGICDVCGFRFKLNTLRPLTVDGRVTETRACRSCWTPDQPQLQLGRFPVIDPQAVRNPRPDTGLSSSREVAVDITGVALGVNLGYVTVSTI